MNKYQRIQRKSMCNYTRFLDQISRELVGETSDFTAKKTL